MSTARLLNVPHQEKAVLAAAHLAGDDGYREVGDKIRGDNGSPVEEFYTARRRGEAGGAADGDVPPEAAPERQQQAAARPGHARSLAERGPGDAPPDPTCPRAAVDAIPLPRRLERVMTGERKLKRKALVQFSAQFQKYVHGVQRSEAFSARRRGGELGGRGHGEFGNRSVGVRCNIEGGRCTFCSEMATASGAILRRLQWATHPI